MPQVDKQTPTHNQVYVGLQLRHALETALPAHGVVATRHHSRRRREDPGAFRRAGLVLWGDFDDLRPGVRVVFEDEAGRAINVKLAR
jgi:hypothetical protein